MFIRPCYRYKNGKNHAYWALVESYRTERGPRQRIVSYLGLLKESERPGIKRAAKGNKESFRQLQLFDTDNKPEPDWVEVDTTNIRVENQLDFGGPWLALQLIHKLKLDELLETVECQLLQDDWQTIRQGLEVKICRSPDDERETYILCRSQDRREKEKAMHERFGIRKPIGYWLISLSASWLMCHGKHCTKWPKPQVWAMSLGGFLMN